MIPHEFIDGPIGPFAVPSGPPNTKRVCVGALLKALDKAIMRIKKWTKITGIEL